MLLCTIWCAAPFPIGDGTVQIALNAQSGRDLHLLLPIKQSPSSTRKQLARSPLNASANSWLSGMSRTRLDWLK
jgi:hypothetical protein